MTQLQTQTVTHQATSRLIVFPEQEQERLPPTDLSPEVESFLRTLAEMIVETLS